MLDQFQHNYDALGETRAQRSLWYWIIPALVALLVIVGIALLGTGTSHTEANTPGTATEIAPVAGDSLPVQPVPAE